MVSYIIIQSGENHVEPLFLFFRIDSGFVIKVADFGLSESIDSNKDYFRQGQDDTVKLPIKWLAPESINDGIFSEKTDVVGESYDNYASFSFVKKSLLYSYHVVGIWCDVLGGV